MNNLKEVYDDLGGPVEVAEALNVTIWRVRAWIERRERVHCPQPVRKLTNAHIYSIAEWQGWYRRWSQTRGYEAQERPTKGYTPKRLPLEDIKRLQRGN